MTAPYEKPTSPEQYQGGQTWNRRGVSGGASKETAIKKAMDRKERSIKGFADAKSTQISVSSAFNGAAAIATALLEIGAIKPEEFWNVQEDWYYEYLDLYNKKQHEATDEPMNEKGRKDDLFRENKENAGQELI